MCLLLPPIDPLTWTLKEILVRSAHCLIIRFILLLTHRLLIVPVCPLDFVVSNSNVSLVFLYSRNQLLSFHSMGKLSCTPMLLMKLKSMDILRYHGNRSGWLSKARSMRNGLRIPTTSLNWSHYRFLLNIWSVTSLLQNHEPLCYHCGGYCANNWITIRLEPPSFNSPSFVPLVFFPSELSIYQWQVVTNKEFYCQPRYWPMRPYKDVASWERLRFVQHSWYLPRWICFLPCT